MAIKKIYTLQFTTKQLKALEKCVGSLTLTDLEKKCKLDTTEWLLLWEAYDIVYKAIHK